MSVRCILVSLLQSTAGGSTASFSVAGSTSALSVLSCGFSSSLSVGVASCSPIFTIGVITFPPSTLLASAWSWHMLAVGLEESRLDTSSFLG
ncbi:hypothetical protein BDV96DRAFT_572950 [Lophiotrema nucula]|uniref:REJ domain-containing protein n=1 Tax=Lophiotrema nucula TaxID=690887 RepID=A0A6A5ZC65_9PLEO|nr:hypothetical protein BDV96DRAFT_572950 [Lophiotrema nucula]